MKRALLALAILLAILLAAHTLTYAEGGTVSAAGAHLSPAPTGFAIAPFQVQMLNGSNFTVGIDASILDIQDGGGTVSTGYVAGEASVTAQDTTGNFRCSLESGVNGLGGGLKCYDNFSTGNLQYGAFGLHKFSVDMPFCFQDGSCMQTAAQPSNALPCPTTVLLQDGGVDFYVDCDSSINFNAFNPKNDFAVDDFGEANFGNNIAVADNGGDGGPPTVNKVRLASGAIRSGTTENHNDPAICYQLSTDAKYHCNWWDGTAFTFQDTVRIADGGLIWADGTTQATAPKQYAIISGTTTTAAVGATLIQAVFSAPSAGVPSRFAFRVNTAGLGAANVTISLFDSTTSASKGTAVFACTATGDQNLAVTSPTAWAVNDMIELRIDDSSCTAANGPVGIPSASIQWQ